MLHGFWSIEKMNTKIWKKISITWLLKWINKRKVMSLKPNLRVMKKKSALLKIKSRLWIKKWVLSEWSPPSWLVSSWSLSCPLLEVNSKVNFQDTHFFSSSSHSGIVVARLPFQPMFLVQGMSHRGTKPISFSCL